MGDVHFDANDTVGGYKLTEVKRAISMVGLLDDRDDVKNVVKALECTREQAERFLAALERRGIVTKGVRKNQWQKTPLGTDLTYRWHPPRRTEPALLREDDGLPTNAVLEIVPCSIFRCEDDDSCVFEEADFEVGVFFEYETARLIEMSVSRPDYYDHREKSAVIETTVHLGVEEAKKIYKSLGEAIAKAEAELTRRANVKPITKRRRSPTRPDDKAEAVTTPQPARPTSARAGSKKAGTSPPSSSARRRDALEATLKELRRGK